MITVNDLEKNKKYRTSGDVGVKINGAGYVLKAGSVLEFKGPKMTKATSFIKVKNYFFTFGTYLVRLSSLAVDNAKFVEVQE